MKKYSIRIFSDAENDLDEIIDYLTGFSEQTALKYYDLLIEKIGTLTSMPERYPLVRDVQLRLRGYRWLKVNNYIVFYIVNESTIEIHRILFARRQYEGLLK
jgi:plasmid stabilization system protein ParE